MHVTKKDLDVVSDMVSMISNAIEQGAEDEDYWGGLHDNACELLEKMKKQRERYRFRIEVKRELQILRKKKHEKD